jgi:hypothetical protein
LTIFFMKRRKITSKKKKNVEKKWEENLVLAFLRFSFKTHSLILIRKDIKLFEFNLKQGQSVYDFIYYF